tara:strand:- start:113 stop:676 length:564 start_codon:yes stop_codon:yes gene_type:complete
MSTLKVSTIAPIGTDATKTITLGASGDTLTIPSGCTISNSGTASGFGKIGQVKSVLLGTQEFTNSTSFAETEATLAITPTSTSSKILIYWDVSFRRNNSNVNTYAQFQLYKDGSSHKVIDNNFSNTMGEKLWCRANYHLLDSPSTTSSTTYAVYWARGGTSESGGFYLCDGGSSAATGSFTLMEVLD